MSKKLARLLAKPEAEIATALSRLEDLCGYPSEDARLLAENRQRVRMKIAELNLDPDDTTDEELYYQLLTRFERDTQLLNEALKVDGRMSLDDRLSKAIQLANHCTQVGDAWLLKCAAAKAILTDIPPKQVAKKLHYRSISSLLKREDIAELYLVADNVESAVWRRTVSKQATKLTASAYELRSPKVVRLSSQRWGQIEGPGSHLVIDRYIGAVSIWPDAGIEKASVLCLALLLLKGLQRLNPNTHAESLQQIHPVLRWWADGSYLISDGQQPVSFNLRDVAYNHLKKYDLQRATARQARQSLWSELIVRYKRISVPEALTEFEDLFKSPGYQPKLPTEQELAAEYVTAE